MIVVAKVIFDVFCSEQQELYGEIATSCYVEDGTVEKLTCYVDGLRVIAVETRDLQTGEIVYEINKLDQETLY